MTDIYAPPASSLLQVPSDGVAYAARWRRFCALAVDMCVVLIAVYVLMFFVRADQTLSYYFVPFHGFSFALYKFYMDGVSGQTFGKRLLKIRVVRLDGVPMGFGASARRAILYACASVPWVVAKMIALSQIPPGRFAPLDPGPMRQLEQSLMPAWWEPVSIVVNVYVLAQILSCIFTARRQTLSDLISGTVVVNCVPRVIEPAHE